MNPSAEQWVAFASAQTDANIFHHPAWTNLLAECYDYRPFVVAERDPKGIVCAGVPMMETGGRLTRRQWTSLPFTDHCALLYDSERSRVQLIDTLIRLSLEAGTPPVEMRSELPPHPAVHAYSRHVLHTLRLQPDSEAVFAGLQPMHRRNVRTAMKRGVRIERGNTREDVEAFYRLHLETRRRQGVPIQPRRFFDLLRRDLLERELGFVLSAYRGDECIASAVFLHWQRTLTYKFGASTVEGLSLRPNNLLFWTAIQWGCENGYAVLDMGRTDIANTGLRAFKGGWGAVERPLVYAVLSAEPRFYPTGIQGLGGAAIRHSPRWVCRAAGELLYKHLG